MCIGIKKLDLKLVTSALPVLRIQHSTKLIVYYKWNTTKRLYSLHQLLYRTAVWYYMATVAVRAQSLQLANNVFFGQFKFRHMV